MRMSAAQARAELAKPKKRNKFGAIRTTVDGIVFDSKREAAYYGELKIREKAGEVSAVELQPRFALIGPDGTLICTYRPDFAFFDHVADRFRVVDVKGVLTREFRRVQRMMKSFKGIDVEVVK